jgi:glutamate racemase
MHRSTFNRAVTGDSGKWLLPNGLSLVLTVIVAGILFVLYQLHWIPDSQLAAAALALLIAYVLYTVPKISQSSVLLGDLLAKTDSIEDRILTMSSGVSVLNDTNEFYKQLLAVVTSTSKVDVTYFTPNIPSEFIDDFGKQYWDTINSFLTRKTGLRLRRISTIESAEKLTWLLDTISIAKNPPGYHLHYLNAEYRHTPLNVNIVDDEHAFIFGTEARSKSTEYIYIRDRQVATTLKRYFDLLWEGTPSLAEGGRLNASEIVKLKRRFGIADGSPFPIGVFDSGVGGLSIAREIRRLLPEEDVIYIADEANIPYGDRGIADVTKICDGIVKFLIDHDVKLIVVACNTATAVSIAWLRKTYPEIPFVGVVPAVKPAAQTTRQGKIGILATPATFSTEVFASLVGEFAQGVQVFRYELPGLVEAIEKGDVRTQSTTNMLTEILQPMMSESVDTVVLGCTHLAFVKEEIGKIVGPNIEVIEVSEAIARQVSNVLQQKGIAKVSDEDAVGKMRVYTSGNAQDLVRTIRKLGLEVGACHEVIWADGGLVVASQ